MKRLARILLSALTAMSLMLFAATIVLWVRARTGWVDRFEAARQGAMIIWVHTMPEGVMVAWAGPSPAGRAAGRYSFKRDGDWPEGLWYPDEMDYRAASEWAHWGVFFHRATFRAILTPGAIVRAPRSAPPMSHTVVRIPYWMILVLTFLPGAARAPAVIRRLRDRRRQARGACPNCGYDLRATPDRCPECGTVPGAST